jgi:hypothetical protein
LLHQQAAAQELLRSQVPAARRASSHGRSLWLGDVQRPTQVHLQQLLWWQRTSRALHMLPAQQQWQQERRAVSSQASNSTAAHSQRSCRSQLHM